MKANELNSRLATGPRRTHSATHTHAASTASPVHSLALRLVLLAGGPHLAFTQSNLAYPWNAGLMEGPFPGRRCADINSFKLNLRPVMDSFDPPPLFSPQMLARLALRRKRTQMKHCSSPLKSLHLCPISDPTDPIPAPHLIRPPPLGSRLMIFSRASEPELTKI